MPYYGYFNGTIQPVEQIGVGVTDLALLRGFGLFDYFLTYNGRPFQWDGYWERFANSARRMTLQLPIGKDEVYAILMDLIRRSGQPDVAFRFLLTGGYAPDSISIVQPNFIILTEPIHNVPDEQYEEGIRVMVDDYVREMAEVKTTDYKRVILLAGAMRKANASDILYQKDGEISELSRSNFFIVKGNQLITPNQHILYGITRRVVIDLARPDFSVDERAVMLTDLQDADEAFTTSSTKQVLPIVQVDDLIIGDGKPGPISRELLSRFRALTKKW
ncbi:aminotransferase class IV [Fibrella aestuarina BUZ 2]|uniref:branched-chain-amino-acid transaminase n=1 Tax=Fibrella aestuarina BUZ 2 TaxID=1166018 RepID=I0K684_9BACT|nr:aminotransferase class IV [Fibrella aestuarina]CCG99637.1 aminotransferase class IV [Fibrella aestuarina BUZ 2]